MDNKVVYGWFHDNQIFYVGIGSIQRSKSNYRRSPYCSRKRAKAEREGTFEVVIFADKLTWEEACSMEQQLIQQYGRFDLGTGCLTNMTDGGEGAYGLVHSESSKDLIRKSRQGKSHTEKTKEKISESHKGGKNHRSRSISTPFGEFDSISEAVPVIGVSNTVIWKRVNSDKKKYSNYYYTG